MSSPSVVSANESSKKDSWKRLFTKAAGFGAGLALVLCLMAGGAMWYVSRPKPPAKWNEKVITATYSGSTLRTIGEELEIRHKYAFHNSLDTDYLIPQRPTGEVMGKAEGGLELTPLDNATWESGIKIPSKQVVNITFTISFKLADYNTDAAKLADNEKLIQFAERRFKEDINTMEFYDYTNRYRILMPPVPKHNSSRK